LPKKKYRSRFDIIVAILKAAADGALQTTIMYSVYLSFTQVKDYLDVLTRRGLLQKDMKTMRFRTTARGREFLKKYEWIKI